ncbi:MAG: PIN domain-containing protein [Geminicoccaceae bacterium]
MRPILVDSSVWIDFFANRRTWAVEELDRMFGREEVRVADLILMEILQGISTRRELHAVETTIGRLPCYNLGGAERARSAAANYRLLRASGLTPRSPVDMLIATFCVEERVELLANDRDFTLMARKLELSLRRPPLN